MDRWPGWVYGVGDEPDYRFSLANERTLLAWVRTALALLAGGVAVGAFEVGISAALQELLGASLVGLGLVVAAASWIRWARSERAIRTGRPLPSSALGAVLAGGVVAVGVLVLAVILR